MKRLILLFLLFIFFVLIGNSVLSYTASPHTNVILTLDETENYVADSFTNVTLILDIIVELVDSCTYTSGNWNVQFIDNCTITVDVSILGNNLSLFGDVGRFDVRAKITDFDRIIIHGDSPINVYSGGFESQ